MWAQDVYRFAQRTAGGSAQRTPKGNALAATPHARHHARMTADTDSALAPAGTFAAPEAAVYLNGNSLGLMPVVAQQRVQDTLATWAADAVAGWNTQRWVDLPRRTGDKIARLIGAQAGEVIVADSTSVNLYKLLHAALALRPGRRAIVCEQGNFPTDLYVMQGLAAARPEVELRTVAPDAVVDALDDTVAVVSLSHVNYRDGRRFDLPAITRAVHDAGALVVWDLAHSAGAVPLALSDSDADFAVGCGYKFLNGGPGAPAFAYVAQRHQAAAVNPIAGWFGHARPFAFEAWYDKAVGIEAMQVGTPPILSLAALDAALDVMLDVDLPTLFSRADAMYRAAWSAVQSTLVPLGFECISPPPDAPHGSQISLRHASAWPMIRALAAAGMVGDFRAPDVLRFGFTPLYTPPDHVHRLVDALADIARTRRWDHPDFHAAATVT